MIRCSASFGPEIWDAKNYGQVTYAIKTRNGDIYLELESRYGSHGATAGTQGTMSNHLPAGCFHQ